MKVNIAHHPTQEAFAQNLGSLLNQNGYKIQFTAATDGQSNGVEIDVNPMNSKEILAENKDITYAITMTSAFVDVDNMPGY